MDCDRYREAISALLDDEAPAVSRRELDEHLTGCAACRAWRERAHEVTRRMRLGSARLVPARTNDVIGAINATRGGGRRVSVVALVRVGLVAIAAAQVAITIPVLVLGHDRDAPLHVAHETGSFDLALAVGFLVAAWRPCRALGMRSVIGAAAGLLVLTAVLDLASGHTTLSDETPHLLAVAGWLLLRHLSLVVAPGQFDRPVSVVALLRSRMRAASKQQSAMAVAASGSSPVLDAADQPASQRAASG